MTNGCRRLAAAKIANTTSAIASANGIVHSEVRQVGPREVRQRRAR